MDFVFLELFHLLCSGLLLYSSCKNRVCYSYNTCFCWSIFRNSSLFLYWLESGLWRWSAIFLGFIGVLMIMRPGFGDFSIFYLFPVGVPLGYAVSSIMVRLYLSSTDTGVIQLHTQIYTFIFSFIIMLILLNRSHPKLFDGGLFLAVGIFGGIGVLCLITCYRLTEPSQIAPFEYFSIPISFLLGWLFFSEAPIEKLFPGVFIIIVSGLIIIWRENYQAKSKKQNIGRL